jgi:hypothetical protein
MNSHRQNKRCHELYRHYHELYKHFHRSQHHFLACSIKAFFDQHSWTIFKHFGASRSTLRNSTSTVTILASPLNACTSTLLALISHRKPAQHSQGLFNVFFYGFQGLDFFDNFFWRSLLIQPSARLNFNVDSGRSLL